MEYTAEKFTGKILKRYKRFFADVELDNGELITAHTPNTGSMKTCWEPGWKAMVTFHDNPKRKLKYTLEMTHNGKTWIGVNTSKTNHIAKEAIEKGLIPELNGFSKLSTEKKIGKSRIDLHLEYENAENPEEPHECYVEVKNVTLSSDVNEELQKNLALFPDAITTRGQKHLEELIDIVKSGKRAAMLYVVQREDMQAFSPADLIDHEYGRLLRKAKDNGVEILVYQCKVSPDQVQISHSIPLIL
jgi:sugar fermentation stimulation protein A